MEQNNSPTSPSNAPTQPVVNEPEMIVSTQPQPALSTSQPVPNAPHVIQPSLTNTTGSAPHKHHWLAMAIGLIVISIIAVGGYFFSPYNSMGYKISYSTPHYGPLKDYKVSMGDKERVSELSVPTEFIDLSNSNTHKQSINLINNEIYNHNVRQLALINLNSSPHGVFKSNFNQIYGSILANPKDTDFKDATSPLRNSAISLLGSSYNYTFKLPQVFKSSNIKQGTWTMDFTATAKVSTLKTPNKVQGRVLTSFTSNNVYFLIAYAETNNWKANTNTWQQVFDSLKLNQQ